MASRIRVTQRTVAVLLASGAAIYAVGGIAEASVHQSPAPTHPSTAAGARTETGNEGAEQHPSATQGSTSSEAVAGINLETPVFVGGAVFAFVALAAALWIRHARVLVVAAALLAATAVVLDIREVAHQVVEGRTLLVVVASVLIVVHLATAGAAGLSMRPWLSHTN